MSQRNSDRETNRLARPGWFAGGWVAPAITIAFTIVWPLLIYLLIGNRMIGRTWQYGTPPYVPAQSPATSAAAQPGAPPNQVVLPILPTDGGQNVRR